MTKVYKVNTTDLFIDLYEYNILRFNQKKIPKSLENLLHGFRQNEHVRNEIIF